MIYTYPMETMDAERTDYCSSLTDEQYDLARDVLARIAGKWPVWVLSELAENEAPLRFSRLLERVEGVTQKVLTQTLRQLERDGLVTRTLYPQVPPRVEYALTPLGRELLAKVRPLAQWVMENVDRFGAARDVFDAR